MRSVCHRNQTGVMQDEGRFRKNSGMLIHACDPQRIPSEERVSHTSTKVARAVNKYLVHQAPQTHYIQTLQNAMSIAPPVPLLDQLQNVFTRLSNMHDLFFQKLHSISQNIDMTFLSRFRVHSYYT
jgi:conjugal transfer/entry exclusion protein